MKTLLLAAGLAAAGSLAFDLNAATLGLLGCKCFPGDACWPSSRDWDALNQTVSGRLIATVPIGHVCHDPNYDPARCQALRDGWQSPATHMDDSASVMAPFFANQSCDPFTSRSRPCKLGNYVAYAVEAQSVADVVATVNFAKDNNIRFVIRNTGHDILGRSTGAGALSVWTHRLRTIEFKDWQDKYYTGSAVKLGAGVQGFDILSAGLAKKQVVLSGECSTVGLAGGYTQGGGHSALSTSFGLSADNTLEFEVVTAAGKLLTASRTQNTDLYWALSGGGPGNYGVVVSMTVRTFPDAHVGGATLSFYNSDNPLETFYGAIDAFHAALPAMVEAGSMVVYYFTSTFFRIAPLTAYNKTAAEVEAIMEPLLTNLTSRGVTYTSNYSQSATYYKHYDRYFGPLPIGNIPVGVSQYGGRLVPFSSFQNNPTGMSRVTRYIAEQGVTWIGVGTDVSPFGKHRTNAVTPAWRVPLVHATLATEWSNDPADWDKMLAKQRLMTCDIMPRIEAVTPGSGAYMNEADFRQPGFQKVFFGSNYQDLLRIKHKYDPESFFYARKVVGSERWDVADDGRMCRLL
ncbi:putative isoamyl alcohol oxidase [Parathielavia hyrcaniae]|uniref:Isoamyl alcohol oxidase n=1 Tax=Parathielavia hyrcaniae TaxID=113614 RepID=A0AAN6Q373_9PEZI|nr:putative isoamyl alcohol oxidase [Parathielavia hyrcaniae]